MRVVLAGGGTTGHISPMLATAEALRTMDPDGTLTCVGTPVGLETDLVPSAGFTLKTIDPVPLPRGFSPKLFTLPVRLGKAVGQARAILTEAHPDVVVGFGGYASLPVFLAARWLKIPVVVHEGNAVPGLANRIASRFAKEVLVTFPDTGLPREIVIGMPVRSAISSMERDSLRPTALEFFELEPDARVVLVSGGSQGAKRLNDAIWNAAHEITAAGVSILHITGRKNFLDFPNLEMPPENYARVPYVEHMEQAYAAADLMVARSGAGTVTETAIIGLPAIFVPLPHGNGEQAKNAASVVAAGAGILIDDADLTGERLAKEVVRLFSDQTTLTQMGQAGQHLMPRNSAQILASRVLVAGRSHP